MDQDLQRLFEEARANVEQQAPQQVAKRLEDGEVDLVIDVREPVEVQMGRIPGAVHIPLARLAASADPSASAPDLDVTQHTEGRVVVYCSHGFRSLLGADALKKLGYADVVSLEGGLVSWSQEGLPIDF